MIDKMPPLSTTLNNPTASRVMAAAPGLVQGQQGATLRDQLLAHAEQVMPADRNQVNFSGRMSNALQSVAEAQNQSARITRDYELGRETDLSKVMVQQQVSSLGFQMTLNVRNKVLSAYQEIMNMPV